MAPPPSAASLAQEAEHLLRTSHAAEVLALAERGLQAFPSPNQPEHWRLRVVQIAALASLERFEERKRVLQLVLPNDQKMTKPAIQFQIAQSKGGPELEALLAEARRLGFLDLARRREATVALQEFAKDPVRGRKTVDRVLAEARAAGDTKTFTYAAGELGFLLAGQFRLDEAMRMLEEARKAASHAGDIATTAYAEANIGWLHQLIGQEEKAIEAFTSAARTFDQLGIHGEHRLMLRNLGGIAFYRGDYRKAGEFFEQARSRIQKESDPRSVAGLLSDLAANAAASGDIDGADRILSDATRIEGHQEIFEYPWMLLTRGRIAEARGNDPTPHYREAAALTSRDRTAALEAYLRIASYLRQKKQTREAETAYREALASVRRLRGLLQQEDSKMGFTATAQRIYQDWVDFLVESGRERDALIAADESRLQVFTEKSPAVLRLDWMQASLETAKTTAVVYWLGPRRSFAWVVDGRGSRLAAQLPAAGVIAEWVRQYRGFVEAGRDPRQSEFEAPRRLFEELVAKAGVAKAERVLIVPDGLLHWLNFETLPSAKGRFWIEDTRVAVAPALRILGTGSAASTPRGRPLLIGDAAAQGREFPALRHAGAELRAIASLYRAGAATVLTGAQATPEQYRSADPSQYDLIHFAAHAEANAQSPLDSAVILSPDASGAFRLFTREAMQKPLQARLVTLSACKGAGAQTFAGEGLVGFSWAFLRSGARQVVAGLWQVDDASTAELMRSFYGAMEKSGARMTPADALRAAKLEIVRRGGAFAKPYYWGPFQLFTATAAD